MSEGMAFNCNRVKKSASKRYNELIKEILDKALEELKEG